VITVPEVKAADANGDRIVTVAEMQVFHRKATLVTADMNFSISHSVVPIALAFECNDCHGRNGWVLDWKQLGYAKDPGGRFQRRQEELSLSICFSGRVLQKSRPDFFVGGVECRSH
jgi:hypothetical protein